MNILHSTALKKKKKKAHIKLALSTVHWTTKTTRPLLSTDLDLQVDWRTAHKLPELCRFLALWHHCDFCFAFSLVLVDLLRYQPVRTQGAHHWGSDISTWFVFLSILSNFKTMTSHDYATFSACWVILGLQSHPDGLLHSQTLSDQNGKLINLTFMMILDSNLTRVWYWP